MRDRQSEYKVTKEGLARLREQLKETEEKLAKLLLTKQETATNQGDYWHDNPSFYQLEMEERALRRQIRAIHDKLNRVVIFEEGDVTKEVQIGSLVTITFESGRDESGEEMQFTIVDPEMSDPKKGFISYASPLGKAVLGACPGDIRSYSVGEKTFRVKIERVERKNEK